MTSPPKSCNPPARRRPHVNVPTRGKQEECALRISLITRKLICRRATLWQYKSYPRVEDFPAWENDPDLARARFSQSRSVPRSSQRWRSRVFPANRSTRLTRVCLRLVAQLEIDSLRKGWMSSQREIFARRRRHKVECRTFCRNGPRDMQPINGRIEYVCAAGCAPLKPGVGLLTRWKTLANGKPVRNCTEISNPVIYQRK